MLLANLYNILISTICRKIMKKYKENYPCIIEPENLNSNTINPIVFKEIKTKLDESGAVLIRGFKITNAEEFRDFLLNISIEPIVSYSLGPEPRDVHAPGVFTSTNRDGSFLIHLHTEVSYRKIRPRYISFFSLKPAERYTETPICDLINSYLELSDELKNKLQAITSCHYRLIPWSEIGVLDENGIYRSGDALWCRNKSKSEIEKELLASEMRFEWTHKGIETKIEMPLIIRHPENGSCTIQSNFEYWPVYILRDAYSRQWRRLFTLPLSKFNFFILASILLPNLADIILSKIQQKKRRIYLSSEKKDLLNKSDLIQISNSIWNNTIVFNWQQYDVLILDNFRFAHGRMNVPKNQERLTLTSIGNPLDITPYIFNNG